MIFRLFENQLRAFASRQDVLSQVHRVDRLPDLPGRRDGVFVIQGRVAMEVRGRTLKYGLLKSQKPIDVPLLHVRLLRIEIDGKVEEVGDERSRRRSAAAV